MRACWHVNYTVNPELTPTHNTLESVDESDKDTCKLWESDDDDDDDNYNTFHQDTDKQLKMSFKDRKITMYILTYMASDFSCFRHRHEIVIEVYKTSPI